MKPDLNAPTAIPAEAAARPNVLPWPFFLFCGAAFGGWLLGQVLPLPWLGPSPEVSIAAGLILLVPGVILFAWAVITFAHHRTTVLPHKSASALVTSGPFAFCRNPIYLADTLFFLAAAAFTQNLWFAAAGLFFAVFVTLYGIIPEERHLEAKFGAPYQAYKARTRRWI